MEDIVVIDTKDYAQVVFDDVHENYSENQPIECWFNLNELLKADTSDWIGIFKVGFVNCKDFVCRQYIDLEFVSENKGKIVFEGISSFFYLQIIYSAIRGLIFVVEIFPFR